MRKALSDFSHPAPEPAASSPAARYDIAIAGGGVAGLALALALRRARAPRPHVALFDPMLDPGAPLAQSLRAVAVTAASVRLLQRLGIWTDLQPSAHPMTAIVLTDAPMRAEPRPIYLEMAGDVGHDEPFAHMVLLDRLRDLLLDACRMTGVMLVPRPIGAVEARGDGLDLVTDGITQESARLLVAADGGRSRLRERAGLASIGHAYGQSAITATFLHERDHGGRAIQHFMPAGPLALLPMRAPDGTGRRTSIVWTETSSEAARLAALPAEDFAAELLGRIGHERGDIRLEDRPTAHPLRLNVARGLIGHRLALVGDAARTIHPLAGQGLNLGFGDVEALAAVVAASFGLGLDPGAPDVLARYQRERRSAQLAMAATTDALNRLFGTDAAPIRALRDLGLSVIDRSPRLKRLFMWQAAGLDLTI